MVKWMIPSITDGDWFPSATEMDQLKTLFEITAKTHLKYGDEVAYEHARKAMIVFFRTVKEATDILSEADSPSYQISPEWELMDFHTAIAKYGGETIEVQDDTASLIKFQEYQKTQEVMQYADETIKSESSESTEEKFEEPIVAKLQETRVTEAEKFIEEPIEAKLQEPIEMKSLSK